MISFYQYIDPSSGSFMLQLIIAGSLGVLYSLKRYIGAFFSFVVKPFKRNSLEEKPSPLNTSEAKQSTTKDSDKDNLHA